MVGALGGDFATALGGAGGPQRLMPLLCAAGLAPSSHIRQSTFAFIGTAAKACPVVLVAHVPQVGRRGAHPCPRDGYFTSSCEDLIS